MGSSISMELPVSCTGKARESSLKAKAHMCYLWHRIWVAPADDILVEPQIHQTLVRTGILGLLEGHIIENMCVMESMIYPVQLLP